MSNTKKTYPFPVVKFRTGMPATFFKRQIVYAENHEKALARIDELEKQLRMFRELAMCQCQISESASIEHCHYVIKSSLEGGWEYIKAVTAGAKKIESEAQAEKEAHAATQKLLDAAEHDARVLAGQVGELKAQLEEGREFAKRSYAHACEATASLAASESALLATRRALEAELVENRKIGQKSCFEDAKAFLVAQERRICSALAARAEVAKADACKKNDPAFLTEPPPTQTLIGGVYHCDKCGFVHHQHGPCIKGNEVAKADQPRADAQKVAT